MSVEILSWVNKYGEELYKQFHKYISIYIVEDFQMPSPICGPFPFLFNEFQIANVDSVLFYILFFIFCCSDETINSGK